MPEIPLLDREGKPLRATEAYLTLQVVMYSPNDENCVAPYLSLTADGLTELFKKTFLKLSKRATGGTVAAMIFLRLLQLKIHRPKDASVGKAVFLVSTALKKKSLTDRKRMPTGRGYVHDLWFEFRPAAHLWGAAFQLSESGVELEEDPRPYTEGLIYFAREMFELAVATNIDLGPDPWQVPNSYPRTMPTKFGDIIKPPTMEIVELLESYNAADRRS
jgi:hypothetical protein